jgi:hypothetical protein
MNILHFLGSYLPCFAPTPPSGQSKKDEKRLKAFEDLGFPKDIAVNYPEAALFLMESKAAYTITLFRNSTPEGQERHQLRSAPDGHPLLKVEGAWVRFEEVQERISYNAETEQLISKNNPQEVWTYISPDGFVKKDPYGTQALYPVEQISKEKQKELLDIAKSFVFEDQADDDGEEKECVLQVYTTKREALPRNFVTRNFLDHAIEHPGIRIIESSGTVYSFGAVMPKKDARELEQSAPFEVLSTGVMKVRACDHEEGYEFQERRVTSIPISSKKAKEILEFASSVNAKELSFNFIRQNCVKFAALVLKKAGISVDTRVTTGQFFQMVLPDCPKLPLIGAISTIAQAFFAHLTPYIPTLILVPIKQVCTLINYIDRKVWALFRNFLSLHLFGSGSVKRALPPDAKPSPQMNDNELTQFERLISFPEDIFDEEKLDMYYASKLVDWQMKQRSTVVHKFDGQTRIYF